jgi:hypothetical protein
MSRRNDVAPLPILRRFAPDEARQIRALLLLLGLGEEVHADQADRPRPASALGGPRALSRRLVQAARPYHGSSEGVTRRGK